jgi:hypothetical protein
MINCVKILKMEATKRKSSDEAINSNDSKRMRSQVTIFFQQHGSIN